MGFIGGLLGGLFKGLFGAMFGWIAGMQKTKEDEQLGATQEVNKIQEKSNEVVAAAGVARDAVTEHDQKLEEALPPVSPNVGGSADTSPTDQQLRKQFADDPDNRD